MSLYRLRIQHSTHAFLSTRTYTADEARTVAHDLAAHKGVLVSLEPATVKQEDAVSRERQHVRRTT